MSPPNISDFSAAHVVPVVLSGGSGTRLWPKSRKAYPKQLHKMYGEYTMLQHTLQRVEHLASPIVVCNQSQRFMVAEQLSVVCRQQPEILLEPVGRNTAPAIAVAAYQAIKDDPDAVLVVLAADHVIKDQQAFHDALGLAVRRASEGKLVTFGVPPTRAETGYGYIKAADASAVTGSAVKHFTEKPNQKAAKKYYQSGEYLWNSGMFVFRAKQYIEELAQFEPALVAHCQDALSHAQRDLDFVRLCKNSFAKCKDVSIDYALMEKTGNAWVLPLVAQWTDLGDWQAVWESAQKDECGNDCVGDVILENCGNSLFHSEDRLIVGVGLRDVFVIDTDDAVLVVGRDHAQDVKKIVEALHRSNRTELDHHRQVFRPWGSYDSIDQGERYQVKCIEVKPGASLSLQMHHHRAEHWVVVCGTALVQRGEEEILLTENQSIYIPLGKAHRLTNPGKLMLQLIEVQSGSYLGEDDIVRLEDSFGRT